METRSKFINVMRFISASLIITGFITFLIGIFVSGSTLIAFAGIGTITGASFIFLISIFLVMTEEYTKKI